MMLKKPKECIGCRWYGDGKGYVPDRIPPKAEVVVLLQNPGKYEEEGKKCTAPIGRNDWATEDVEPQPLIGPTGYVHDKSFLPLTGLSREEVGFANVLRCRKQLPNGERTNDMPDKAEYSEVVEHCTKAHLRLPESTKLVIAQGAHAWKLLGGPPPVSDWRGHLLPAHYGSALANGEKPRWYKVLATIHLADLHHHPKMDLVTRKDFNKVQSILTGKWPKRVPEAVNVNTESLSTVIAWFTEAKKAPWIVVDTEYGEMVDDKARLALIGIGYPGDPPGILQYCPFEHHEGVEQEELYFWTRDLLASVPTVFQNALADVPVLRPVLGIDWHEYRKVEDTMQAHAVLWCELPHDLEFQSSVDGQYPKMKHLMGVDLRLYNKGDLLETISSWEARLDEFSRDPLSKKVYDTQMRVLPHLDRSMRIGLRVNKEKVPQAILKYEERTSEGEAIGRAYCGWPINMRSPEHVKTWLYEREGLPVQKHPESKKRTANADAVATLRTKYLPFDPKQEEDEMSAKYILERIEEGAHPLLEAIVLHGHADHVLSHYLYPLVKK